MQLTFLDMRPLRSLPAMVVGMLAALPANAAEGLVLMPDLETLPVLLVAFVVVTLVLDPLIFRPLMKVMDEREERIDGARRRADQVQQQAEEALSRYQEAILGAHDDATAERRRRMGIAREGLVRLTNQAKEEAEREVARAREELSASLDEARDSLRQAADGLAILAAERILGRSLAQ
jgi:F-type H+-transporting ATPase subunit b